MTGTGYAQSLSAIYILSYYMSIVALCLYYFIMCFNSTLPWSICREGWANCVPSGDIRDPEKVTGPAKSSAEYYFERIVLHQKSQIDDGIGFPLWHLALCLFISWIMVFLINARGVKTSGKAAYFLALFPYVIMIILLFRAVTLPGAGNGISFFITPVWSKISELDVWYAAVTQAFFSLSVCSGALIMFSSYNKFRQNIYRDSLIVTTLDTLTSMISGFTIFGVLGNLAYQLGIDDVRNVTKSGGVSLAFVSYPDAIAQSPFLPQFFAFLFFLMMLVLGVGSGVALHSTVNTILLDAFPHIPTVLLTGLTSFIGFFMGLPYTTPGGQQVLTLVDFYGGTFMRLFAAIIETIGVFWIYGLENHCVNLEFMVHKKTSFYWRICWSIITPILMSCVFVYSLITKKQLKFAGSYIYPKAAYLAGSGLQYLGVSLVPLFMMIAFYQRRTSSCCETMKQAFKPLPIYGPAQPQLREEWLKFTKGVQEERAERRKNFCHHIWMSLFGGYRRGKPIPK